jgi:hypothetical protein
MNSVQLMLAERAVAKNAPKPGASGGRCVTGGASGASLGERLLQSSGGLQKDASGAGGLAASGRAGKATQRKTSPNAQRNDAGPGWAGTLGSRTRRAKSGRTENTEDARKSREALRAVLAAEPGKVEPAEMLRKVGDALSGTPRANGDS